MTAIGIDGHTLTITFPGWERIMAGRSTHSVPRSSVASVEVLDGWSAEILGVRRGLAISGYRKLGTFLHPNGTHRLVSMTRGQPLLRIGLHDREAGGGFDELLLSCPDGQRLAAELRAGAVT